LIDNFSILLSHALLAYAFWLLMHRADLDLEEPVIPDTDPKGFASQHVSTKRKPQMPPDA
jgi:hypothetical protein